MVYQFHFLWGAAFREPIEVHWDLSLCRTSCLLDYIDFMFINAREYSHVETTYTKYVLLCDLNIVHLMDCLSRTYIHGET